jgi:hypothetical protein
MASMLSRKAATSPPPPLPCLPGASPFHIKGLSYRGLVRQIEALEGLDRFCDALGDAALQAFVRQPFLASGRYDILPFFPLTHAFAHLRGVRFEDFVRASTAAQARYDATHVYKMIFDADSPGDIAARVTRFNTQVYDFGEFNTHHPGPKRAVTDFAFIPSYLTPWFGPMHAAYAQESLTIGRAKDVVIVSQTARDAGTREGFALTSFLTEFRWR